MAKPAAPELRHRVAFDRRGPADDEAGNTEGVWELQFECAAGLRHRGGSESVQAARLEGRHVLSAVIRSSRAAREITADWRMRDIRTGVVYAIRVADTVTDAEWIWLTVESGVAP